jgi:chromosome segregation ATPase
MSVFLGGRWRELQVENQRMQELLTENTSRFQQLETQLTNNFNTIKKKQEELESTSDILSKTESDKQQLLEIVDTQTKELVKLRGELERKSFECEDALGWNVILKGKKDLGEKNIADFCLHFFRKKS